VVGTNEIGWGDAEEIDVSATSCVGRVSMATRASFRARADATSSGCAEGRSLSVNGDAVHTIMDSNCCVL
jgi:hypothetical protein